MDARNHRRRKGRFDLAELAIYIDDIRGVLFFQKKLLDREVVWWLGYPEVTLGSKTEQLRSEKEKKFAYLVADVVVTVFLFFFFCTSDCYSV